MSEPSLEKIEDYNSLKGEKRKVVWTVVLIGLLIGVIYSISNSIYSEPEGAIEVKENTSHNIPMK